MRVKNWFCQKCFGHLMREDALQRQHLVWDGPKFWNTNYSLPPIGTTIKCLNL